MKWISSVAIASILMSSIAFASEPVILSAPSPAIAATYSSGTSTTVIYTVTNNVPQKLPLTVSGISNEVTRTTVSNDCGNEMAAGPSSCKIGVTISPTSGQIGTSVNQTLVVDYQGRTTLKSPIAFSVIQSFFAYVIPSIGATTILQFALDTVNGTLSSTPIQTYTSVGSPPQSFAQLIFATVNTVQYGYATDQNGYVYQCIINTSANGTFDSCTSTPSSVPGWNPRSIAFATIGGTQYAYVTDVGSGSTYQCFLDVGGPTNGAFSSCSVPSGSPSYPAPYGITFATVNGTQYAYIADVGIGGAGNYGDVYKCSMNNDGSFNTCGPALSSGVPLWLPYAITFATSNAVQYAYVSDNGSGAAGNVYQCSLNNDGTFSSCSAIPSSGAPSWSPVEVAFATLEGKQYSYVASVSGSSPGLLYVCEVDSGLFSNCATTPAVPPMTWAPWGVSFRFN